MEYPVFSRNFQVDYFEKSEGLWQVTSHLRDHVHDICFVDHHSATHFGEMLSIICQGIPVSVFWLRFYVSGHQILRETSGPSK